MQRRCLITAFIWFTAVVAQLGCEPLPAQSVRVHLDLAASPAPVDGSILPDEADGGADVFPAPDLGLDGCTVDDDCGDRAWCQPSGRCASNLDEPFFEPRQDGLTRAGAAEFSLIPDYFETWQDRASPECPDNRMGRFDGNVYDAKPDDPCLDTFDDANLNGRFDAAWLGGPQMDRPAQDVDLENPPEGRVMLVNRDESIYVLITLDLYEMDLGRISDLKRRLRGRLGLSPQQLSIHVTGVRSAPDATGLSGPSRRSSHTEQLDAFHLRSRGAFAFLDELPIESGVDEAWYERLVVRIDAAVRQAADKMTPVAYRQINFELPVAPLDLDDRANAQRMLDSETAGVEITKRDLRRLRESQHIFARELQLPGVVDKGIQAISLDGLDNARSQVMLLGWGATPNFDADGTELTADYVGVVRTYLESKLPGATVIWLTSTSTNTYVAGSDLFIPSTDEDGAYVDGGGRMTDTASSAARSSTPMEALARRIAAEVLTRLDEATTTGVNFRLQQRWVWLPMSSLRVAIASWLGLLPHLRNWLVDEQPTPNWVSGEDASACGGFGCLRYQAELVHFSGQTQMMLVPGAWDQSYVRGRASQEVTYLDERQFMDADGDGILDSRDQEILISTSVGERTLQFELEFPLNPQRFSAIDGIEREGLWVVGRSNGGLGSLRPQGDVVNRFEGMLDAAWTFTRDESSSRLALCAMGYPCRSDLGVGTVIETMLAAQPTTLANIRSTHELRCMADVPTSLDAARWRLTDGDGLLLAQGDDLILGPGERVFSLSTNFDELPIDAGALLWLDEFADSPWRVANVVAAKLERHPNVGDAAYSLLAPSAGDILYNAVCELMDDACNQRQAVAEDPNTNLPWSVD
ncbi:MAG: hypothetical protein ACON3Z_08660 [Bradymonadia bacterium]